MRADPPEPKMRRKRVRKSNTINGAPYLRTKAEIQKSASRRPPHDPPELFLRKSRGRPPQDPPNTKRGGEHLERDSAPGPPEPKTRRRTWAGRRPAGMHTKSMIMCGVLKPRKLSPHIVTGGNPPNPKRGGEQTERGSAAGTPGPKMRRLRVGTQCIGG